MIRPSGPAVIAVLCGPGDPAPSPPGAVPTSPVESIPHDSHSHTGHEHALPPVGATVIGNVLAVFVHAAAMPAAAKKWFHGNPPASGHSSRKLTSTLSLDCPRSRRCLMEHAVAEEWVRAAREARVTVEALRRTVQSSLQQLDRPILVDEHGTLCSSGKPRSPTILAHSPPVILLQASARYDSVEIRASAPVRTTVRPSDPAM